MRASEYKLQAPARNMAIVLLAIWMLLGGAAYVRAAEPAASSPSWQLFFSPNGGATAAIVNVIDHAHTEVLVQAYEFTSTPIRNALLRAHKRGLQVIMICDPLVLKDAPAMLRALLEAKVPLYIDRFHLQQADGIAHNKIMVVDRLIVITGSFNFTKAAEFRNAENLLIINDSTMAAAYARNFANHLGHSTTLDIAEIPASRSRRHSYIRY